MTSQPHGSRSLRIRGAVAFLIALSPIIVAVIVNGPSLGLYAAFGSGCLFSVTAYAYLEASADQREEDSRASL